MDADRLGRIIDGGGDCREVMLFYLLLLESIPSKKTLDPAIPSVSLDSVRLASTRSD